MYPLWVNTQCWVKAGSDRQWLLRLMKCKPDIIFHHEKVPFWVGGWRTMMERVGSLLNTKFHYFIL